MDINKKFIKAATEAVVADYNSMGGPQITEDDVFVVWSCKTLQNCKALLSDTVPHDGIYYEVTYNGDKHQMYVDRYRKEKNTPIEIDL